MAPGFRTHMDQNWFLLGAVEVPVRKYVDIYNGSGNLFAFRSYPLSSLILQEKLCAYIRVT